jgi:hypothetical protein
VGFRQENIAYSFGLGLTPSERFMSITEIDGVYCTFLHTESEMSSFQAEVQFIDGVGINA